MARTKESHIHTALTSLFSSQFIRHHARGLGAVKRRRKVDIVVLVWTLVLAFDRGAERSLASLRRAYTVATGTTLAPSAFYARFTPALAELMRRLTERAFAELGRGSTKMKRAFGVFSKLLIADGSLVRLPDALEADYPSVWTNHTRASAKLHVIMNGTTRTPERVRVVPGSSHDLPLMTLEGCRIGALYVFDLAYYQGRLFRQIVEHGGHFLCRVKKDADFRIVSADNPTWVGRNHQAVMAEMRGRSFEAQVDYRYRHIADRDYVQRHQELRLIAIWSHDLHKHRVYLTSAPASALGRETAADVYAVRWEIELLFRELKSQMRLEHMPSGNKAAAECLISASLLALAMSRKLHRLFAPGRPAHLPAERWTILMRLSAPLLLELLLVAPSRRPLLARRLAAMLRHEAPDPNRPRLSLPERARRRLDAAA